MVLQKWLRQNIYLHRDFSLVRQATEETITIINIIVGNLNKGFPSGASVPANAGDVRASGLIPGSGRSLGVENGNLHQCSCPENSTDRRSWWTTVHGTTKSRTQLSTHTHTHTHSPSICLQCGRPGFDPWVRKIPWRRKWQPTPVLLPGKSHGQRSLVGYSPWGHQESDTTERLRSSFHHVAYFNRMVFSRVWHAWEIQPKNWKLNYFVCILEKCRVVFPWSTAK